jgi:hypothetical protein
MIRYLRLSGHEKITACFNSLSGNLDPHLTTFFNHASFSSSKSQKVCYLQMQRPGLFLKLTEVNGTTTEVHGTPTKVHGTPTEAHGTPTDVYVIPTKCKVLSSLNCMVLSLNCMVFPMKCMALPLKCMVLPLKCMVLPLKCMVLPPLPCLLHSTKVHDWKSPSNDYRSLYADGFT